LGAENEGSPEHATPGTRRLFLVIAVVVALVVAAFVIYLPFLTGVATTNSRTASSTGQTSSSSNSSATSTNSSVSVGLGSPPLILNGNASITYPADYQALASYALGVINQDRSKFGLGTIARSPVPSAQQHADSMLYFGYFSHFDTQGFKPYMRYTLLGGDGAVEENIAFISWQSPYYTSTGSAEKSIADLERAMMYNDSACCNNGHRDNILNPSHNRVSIGVAYNSTTLFFVEDFENYYIALNVSQDGPSISFTGTPASTSQGSQEMAVFFDPTPVPQNVSSLNSGPRDYDPGTLVGGIFPPCSLVCPYSKTGLTVYAASWEYTSTQVSLMFSLSQFLQRYGPGVYTLYLLGGSQTNSSIESAQTSLCIFL